MNDEDFDRRLKEIAALTKEQRAGSYTTESDATLSLLMIERLTLLLIEKYEVRSKS